MTNDYITAQPHINKIREALWSDIGYGRACLMVGSGFSTNARSVDSTRASLPTWRELMEEMIKHIVARAVDHDSLNVASKSVSGALRIAEEYVALHGRPSLNALLQAKIPDDHFQPSHLHSLALKLPWSDVFTTNWDRLLERAASQLIARRYNLVLESADISHRVRPRIVKLHGSFPSNGPFIVTEEDFRTYPHKFAPLVNLVQQAMMENVFCLIGFSGNDPNFLSWSGWVRDNLREHMPRIYLCDLLNLRSGERMILESRGIIPIDLSVLFSTDSRVPQSDRYRIALEWFFENLSAGKPPDALEWPDPIMSAPSAVSGLPPIPTFGGGVPLEELPRPIQEGD